MCWIVTKSYDTVLKATGSSSILLLLSFKSRSPDLESVMVGSELSYPQSRVIQLNIKAVGHFN